MFSKTLRASLALSPVACILLAAALSADGVPSAQAQQTAPNARGAAFHCTGSITYAPTGGTPQIYLIDVNLVPGEQFVDDFSTPTREHVFTMNAIQDGNAVKFTANYFSDVTALSWIDLTTGLTMKLGQRAEETSGSQSYWHSTIGSYTVSYTLMCTRSLD